jgi:hypothetical protein
MLCRRLAATLLVLLAAAPDARAAPESLETNYTISLIGLPVGRASFRTTLDGARYRVEGTLASAGLADLVSKTKGTSSVSGRVRAGRLLADRYRLAYTSDAKSWRSDVRYRGGRAVSADVAPPPRNPPQPDFVPVRSAQLASVVDPLSGLMIKPAKPDPVSLCSRTLPFYDGWSRLDLALSPSGTRAFSTEGFEGQAIVCDVRVRAVSGYRTSSNGIKYLSSRTLQIWFAPVRDSGIFAPVYVRIPTEVGPLSLTATTFAKP